MIKSDTVDGWVRSTRIADQLEAVRQGTSIPCHISSVRARVRTQRPACRRRSPAPATQAWRRHTGMGALGGADLKPVGATGIGLRPQRESAHSSTNPMPAYSSSPSPSSSASISAPSSSSSLMPSAPRPLLAWTGASQMRRSLAIQELILEAFMVLTGRCARSAPALP